MIIEKSEIGLIMNESNNNSKALTPFHKRFIK